MRAYPSTLLALAAAALFTACGSSGSTTGLPSGSIAFTQPSGGESWVIGDTVKISWACTGCTDVPSGDLVSVYADNGNSTFLIGQNLQMTDSASWVVGTTLQGVSLNPGFYLLDVNDDAGYYAAQSTFFQVTAAP